MISRPIIRAACLSGMADAIAEAGKSLEEILGEAGLTPRDIADPDSWVSLHHAADLFDVAAKRLGDEFFGLRLGTSRDPRDMGLLAFLVLNSQTLRASLRTLQRYMRVFSDGAEFGLDISGGQATLYYDLAAPDIAARRQGTEWAIGVIVATMREMLGPDWSPHVVHFEHAQPESTELHERCFAAPVLFRQPRTGIVFDAASLNQRPISADSRLFRILEISAVDILASRPGDDDLLGPLKTFVVHSLRDGYPDIDASARELRVSIRTLQRRLRVAGTNYSTLVDDVRRDLARKYLDEDTLTLKEIAHLLGYSQPSAFNRAWRRWTGSTPQEYRSRGGD